MTRVQLRCTGSFRLDAGIRRLHRNHKFAEPLAKTVVRSVRHSCRSELTRQGISLILSILFPEQMDFILRILGSSSKLSL